MRKYLIQAALCSLFFLGVSPGLTAFAAPVPAEQSQNVVHLELSQDRTPTWLQILDKLGWPIVVIVAIIVLRQPASGMLAAVAKGGADLTWGSVKLKFTALEQTVEKQQDQLDGQAAKIQALLLSSISWFIYEMLYQIDIAQRNKGEYLYQNNGSMIKNLRYLMDNGYIQEIYDLDRLQPNDNLCGIVTITGAGHDFIAMRGKP